MRSTLRLVLLVAAFLLAPITGFAQGGSGGKNRAEQMAKPYVIVVSFDGFRHDYLDRVETPNFRRVARAGVRAGGLIPVFPTKTFPNHYSIATGMYAGKHGLVDNTFYDAAFDATYRIGDTTAVRDARWYGGEPIWVTAERQGMVSGSFFFVGSEAAVGGVRPTYSRNYDGSVPNAERVRTVLDWLRLPAERRPHLVMLYFSDVDDAGHRYGPEGPEVNEAVRRVDEALGQLLDGIEKLPIANQVHLVLVSDHGMAAQDTLRAEYLDDYVDFTGVQSINAGTYTTLWVGDTARVNRLHADLQSRLKHARVYRRSEIPERFHYRTNDRVGDLLVLADPGYQVAFRAKGRPSSGGAHGYDPALNLMQGIFLAMGPQIRAGGMLPPFENVNVYPLVAHLLGLTPNPAIDGRLEVLRPILR